MTTFFSAIYFAIVTFEVIVVTLMLLAMFSPSHECLLHFFLGHAGNMTKLGLLIQWCVSTACVVVIWWLSGLSVGWLLVSLGFDVISVPATLWLMKLSKYNPVASESLAG